MSRLVKIVDNKYVQIEEYRNPNICFNTSEYDDFEDYCTLRETFDPFEMFYENQELKKQVEEWKKLLSKFKTQQKGFIKYLDYEKDRLVRVCRNTCKDKFDEADDILQKYKEIIGDDK